MVYIQSREKYISSVFFVFALIFVSPALSPGINGQTIYLNWFVPFLDVYFTKYCINKISTARVKKRTLAGFFILTAIITLHFNFMFLIKIFFIALSVIYLQYAYKRIGFEKLYKAFNINILLAILQFALYFIDNRTAYLFGPGNISRIIWGRFATETNTNFYPIFYFPRTCGLSREAGFFAALLCIMVIVYINDGKNRKTRQQNLLFLTAYIVSFSKMSFALLILLVIFYCRKLINRVPVLIMLIMFIAVMGMFVNSLNRSGFFYLAGGSMTHRFWGYGVVLNHLTPKEFLIGNSFGAEELNQTALNTFPAHIDLFESGLTRFCGLPMLIIYTGYIGLAGFLMFLHSVGVKSGYLLILLISTADVDLITATSFVVLAYWLAIFGTKIDTALPYMTKRF